MIAASQPSGKVLKKIGLVLVTLLLCGSALIGARDLKRKRGFIGIAYG